MDKPWRILWFGAFLPWLAVLAVFANDWTWRQAHFVYWVDLGMGMVLVWLSVVIYNFKKYRRIVKSLKVESSLSVGERKERIAGAREEALFPLPFLVFPLFFAAGSLWIGQDVLLMISNKHLLAAYGEISPFEEAGPYFLGSMDWLDWIAQGVFGIIASLIIIANGIMVFGQGLELNKVAEIYASRTAAMLVCNGLTFLFAYQFGEGMDYQVFIWILFVLNTLTYILVAYGLKYSTKTKPEKMDRLF